jgi:peptidoglycan hydrolase CwlO-like protein
MSEGNTNEMKNSRTFEERVFLRFDAMDARFDRIETRLDSLDGRVERLEAKQYDTKPIWEQALAAVADNNTRIEQVRSEMKAEFASMREQIDHSLHDVEWQIDALNNNILKVQADQKYLEKRQRDFEANLKQP